MPRLVKQESDVIQSCVVGTQYSFDRCELACLFGSPLQRIRLEYRVKLLTYHRLIHWIYLVRAYTMR